jgi:hypothetical protein
VLTVKVNSRSLKGSVEERCWRYVWLRKCFANRGAAALIVLVMYASFAQASTYVVYLPLDSPI